MVELCSPRGSQGLFSMSPNESGIGSPSSPPAPLRFNHCLKSSIGSGSVESDPTMKLSKPWLNFALGVPCSLAGAKLHVLVGVRRPRWISKNLMRITVHHCPLEAKTPVCNSKDTVSIFSWFRPWFHRILWNVLYSWLGYFWLTLNFSWVDDKQCHFQNLLFCFRKW